MAEHQKDTGRRILFSAQKNEAPFLLEWIAYHKVIGFTDIIIVSNDCDDGSDALLDALASAGEITHIRQIVPEGMAPQLSAASMFLDSGYLQLGDWVMWLDIDEYLVVHEGGGKLNDLVEALPDADAIAVAWRVFGDSDREWAGRQVSSAYTHASRKAFFPNSQVKSLFRFDEQILGMELHRPVLSDEATPSSYTFRHSGGGRVPDLFFDYVFASGAPAHRLVGVGARYRLAQVNHYTVRSRELFEAKKSRGNGYVAHSDTTSLHLAHQEEEYFEKYNRNETEDRSILKSSHETFRATERLAAVARTNGAGSSDATPEIAAWWYRGVANFGDEIGPWLVAAITGRKVRHTEAGNPNMLLTVGSVLTMAPKGGAIVWGSGSLRPLDTAVRRKLRLRMPFDIRALRGKLTLQIMEKITGETPPEVLGDPALLLPRLLPAPARQTTDIAVVPHYRHTGFFRTAFQNAPDGLRLVDVSDAMTDVVSTIAGAHACISTSLHGCVVAQAYEVPWLWLRLPDQQLTGDSFKFEDFFTTLERDRVATATLQSNDLTAARLLTLSRQVQLPAITTDLDRLFDAFPFDAVEAAHVC